MPIKAIASASTYVLLVIIKIACYIYIYIAIDSVIKLNTYSSMHNTFGHNYMDRHYQLNRQIHIDRSKISLDNTSIKVCMHMRNTKK